MNNLNLLLLNVSKARQHTEKLLSDIDRLTKSGNVDNQKKAVGSGAELTRSLIDEKHAIDAYMGAVGMSLLSNLDQSKIMTRAAFNALSPRKRLEFSQAGGRVQD